MRLFHRFSTAWQSITGDTGKICFSKQFGNNALTFRIQSVINV
jgi:hypothetical protein